MPNIFLFYHSSAVLRYNWFTGRKPKEIKITYKYVGDESPEKKIEAQKRVDKVFDMIFDEAWKNIREKRKKKTLIK